MLSVAFHHRVESMPRLELSHETCATVLICRDEVGGRTEIQSDDRNEDASDHQSGSERSDRPWPMREDK